jgi:hypothetical protein
VFLSNGLEIAQGLCEWSVFKFFQAYNFICIIILLLCWEYIVTFTKVLTMYLTLIHLITLLYPSSSYNSFNRFHFSIFIHEYIIFLPYSAFYPLSSYPPTFHCCQPPQDLFYLPVLCFRRKYNFLCLRYLDREFHCDISMYVCIVFELAHSLHFSSFYLSPLCDFNSLKILYSFLYREYINHIHLDGQIEICSNRI